MKMTMIPKSQKPLSSGNSEPLPDIPPDDLFEDYKPTSMTIINFINPGDTFIGCLVNIRKGLYGDQINLKNPKDSKIYALPSLVRFQDLAEELKVMQKNFREIWIKVEYKGMKSGEQATNPYKDFSIKIYKTK